MSKNYIFGLTTGFLTPILFLVILFFGFKNFFNDTSKLNLTSIMVNDLSGKFASLNDIANGEDIIVNFWATWCVPCIKEMPILEDIQAETGIKVIAISNQKAGVIEDFIKDSDFEFDIMQYKFNDGSRINVLPTTLFIKENQIIWMQQGSITKNQVLQVIKKHTVAQKKGR